MSKDFYTPNAPSSYQLHPPGTVAAICYSIIDLGTHYNEKFKKSDRLVRIYFETAETMEDGRPFSIQQRFTLSHHEKSRLRAALESWYGQRFENAALDKAGGFNLAKLLGRPALLNIAHSPDGKYANILTISPLPKGMQPPVAKNKQVLFTLNNYTPEELEALPEKTREFIMQSDEMTKAPKMPTSPAGEDDFNDDDIPY